MREHHRDIRDWLREQGAENVRIAHEGQPHPRVYFTWKGEEHRHIVSGSPSDFRTADNTIRQLRHILGLVPGDKRVGDRRRRRAKVQRAAAALPSLSVGADWRDRLRVHPARADDVWRALWRDCMARVGAESRL